MTEAEWSPLCPMCGSKRADESILMDKGVILIEKECPECGVTWSDVYEYTGLDIKDNEELFI